MLYERFFFGDPVRMAGALVTGHAAQIQQYAEKVRELVKEGKDEAFAAQGRLPTPLQTRAAFETPSDCLPRAWRWSSYAPIRKCLR